MVNLNLPKKRIMITDAPAWKRSLSFVIDFFIIQFLLISPFAGIIQSKIPMTQDFTKNYAYIESHPEILQDLIPIFVTIFIIIFAYFLLFELILKQTPGKMIFKLKLTSDMPKTEVKLLNLILRNTVAFPIFPFTIMWVIDTFYLIIKGKRLTDTLTRTRVIEEISL